MKLTGNILVFTQWSFKDALVQRYTLPYVDIIRKIIAPDRKIFLFTSEQKNIALNSNEISQVNNEWQKRNMQLLPYPYKRFGFKKMLLVTGYLFKLIRIIKKEKIRTIHAFCMPAGGIAYLLSKATGADLIIDSYEPHAESMAENGTWKKNGAAYRILFSLEKKQTQRAKVVIATTAGMKQYALEKYGVKVQNFFVKPACVDLEKFYPSEKDPKLLKELGFEDKIICVYAGKLGGIYFKKEVFDFIKLCYDHWKNDFRFLILTSATKKEIDAEVEKIKIPGDIVISSFIFHDDIPRYLSLGDFAINPVKPVPAKRYCTSIKDGEYWAMGLPVVISPNISDDSTIIEDQNAGVVVDFSDHLQLSGVVDKIEKLLKEKKTLKERIRQLAIRYRSFDLAEKIYKEVYK
jgi:glycosyltransferase involved in cell wall biosynthesis